MGKVRVIRVPEVASCEQIKRVLLGEARKPHFPRNKERVTSTKYSRIRATKGVAVANLESPPKELHGDVGLALPQTSKFKTLFGIKRRSDWKPFSIGFKGLQVSA